jgi:hypothetical protein
MASDDAITVERTALRRRVLKAGVVAFSARQVTLKCGIRDISEGGARLTIEGTIGAPDTFELLSDIDGMEVPCQVAWRRGMEVGVRFLEPPRYVEKNRRVQVVDQWHLKSAKPTLRRQPKIA